ncbi:MAG TPA: DUF1937 family protein, partial [Allosphingosinicella sp.]|nr:DUF1937 family protein [Allosphingosinicella sp.]
WAWNNLLWLALAWFYWWILHNTSILQNGLGATFEQLIYGFVAFEVLRTVGDYYINWQFYFPPKLTAAKEASPDIIYIGGPYSNDGPNAPAEKASAAKRLARFHAITEVARHLIEQGEIVYSPLTMTHPIDLRMKNQQESSFWVTFDEAFMEHCRRLIVLTLPGWEQSSGLKREIAFFRERGIEPEERSPDEFGIGKEKAEFAAAFD